MSDDPRSPGDTEGPEHTPERGVDDDIKPEDIAKAGAPKPRPEAQNGHNGAHRGPPPGFYDEPQRTAQAEGRMPPCNLEAEAAVLSAVMTDSSLIDRVPSLRPEQFYSEAHRRMYEGCLALKAAGKPIDTVQLSTWLKDHDRLQQVGGVAYMMEVQQAAPVIANVAHYAESVQAKWRARQAILYADLLRAQAYAGLEVDSVITEAPAYFEKLAPMPSSGIELVYGAALAKPVPPAELLVRDLRLIAGPGAPHMVAGYGGSGKTMAMQSLALSLATGLPTWGCHPAQRHRRVAHIDYEQGDALTRRRYQRLAFAMGIDLESLGEEQFGTASHPRDLRLNEACKMRWLALMTNRDVLIIDSLRAATSGMDENSSDIRQPLDMLGELSDRTGCRAIVIHHARKPKEDQPGRRYSLRGSSAIFDALDCLYIFTGEKGEPVQGSQEKCRTIGQEIEDFALTIEDMRSEKELDAGVIVNQKPVQFLTEKRELKKKKQEDDRVRRDADTVRQKLIERPGLGTKELALAVGMSNGRVSLAIHALGGAVEVREEKRGGTKPTSCHYIRGHAGKKVD